LTISKGALRGHAIYLSMSPDRYMGRDSGARTMSGQIMTIGIRRRAWTRGFAVSLIVAIILVVICINLLGDFLVDWLWFSAIGYLNVFWTIIIAEAEVLLRVFCKSSG
jgi:Uncharacterised protein family (UPF0182)